MKSHIPLILLFYFSQMLISPLLSQKEDHQWIFNWSRIDSCNTLPDDLIEACGANILDFNILPPIFYADESLTLDFKELNTSLCDNNGQLDLYCNGQSIHDSDHLPITNGEMINEGLRWFDLSWRNEINEIRSTGFRLIQGCAFILYPSYQDRFLMLYHNYEDMRETDHYSLLSALTIKNSSEEWELSYKDSLVNDRIWSHGKITACKHANGRDWWVLQFKRDSVLSYLMEPSGLSLQYTNTLPFQLRDMGGQSKFSPQGDQFIIHGGYIVDGTIFNQTVHTRFDRCNGTLSDFIIEEGEDDAFWSGAEWASEGRFFYTSTSTTIYQYDSDAANVLASKTPVAIQDTTLCDIPSFTPSFGQMQRGPDNLIYISFGGQCFELDRINHPNRKGTDCDVELKAIKMPKFHSGTIPNFNTIRLGPLDGSACDTLGIDNNPVSRFWYQQDTTVHSDFQFWDVSYFRPESWEWDFGDGMTSTEQHPIHSYARNGTYEVCLTVSNANSQDSSCQTIMLGTVATSDLPISPQVSIFPNPAVDYTRLVLAQYMPERAYIRFYNTQVQEVLSQRVYGQENTIDVQGLDSGVYVYEIRDMGVFVFGGKLVVR